MRLFAWLLVVGAIVPGLYSLRAPEGDIHAVIVAGSNGWRNYRHQANACHAYHVLRRHGVLPENIILMMYDDMATARENRYPGKLFHKPHGGDVYKGVKVDYSHHSVTPENFLNVLKGNASAVVGGNGRVLKSKSNDRIFVYYSDHGGSGTISFPHGLLTVKELHDTLTWMYINKRYSQLVFYLDACHSGSMFESTLTDELNVYAATSAHGRESSYATYCNNAMELPCLGSEFAVNWMEDSDVQNLNNETLSEQYMIVERKTKLSHPSRYGDLRIADNPVGWFQGEERITQKSAPESPSKYESWPEYDVELLYLYQVLESANDPHEAKQVEQKIRKMQHDRQDIEAIYMKLVNELVSNAEDRTYTMEQYDPVRNLDCHHDVVRAFNSICVNWHKYEYAMKLSNVLTNLCNRLSNSEAIIAAMKKICSETKSRFL